MAGFQQHVQTAPNSWAHLAEVGSQHQSLARQEIIQLDYRCLLDWWLDGSLGGLLLLWNSVLIAPWATEEPGTEEATPFTCFSIPVNLDFLVLGCGWFTASNTFRDLLKTSGDTDANCEATYSKSDRMTFKSVWRSISWCCKILSTVNMKEGCSWNLGSASLRCLIWCYGPLGVTRSSNTIREECKINSGNSRLSFRNSFS
jgi:hypothetical protein